MGRRQRSSRDEEEDDNLEKEWEKKRQRTIIDEDIDTNGQQDKCAKQEEDAKVIKSSSSKEESPDDKIERMKLKKSRQKERRKEKKANTAAAVESRKNATRKVHKEKIGNKKDNKVQQWTTLRKGVQRLDVVVGKGPFVQDRKKCRVSYVLRAKKHISGKILDSSTNFGFRPGKGEVIQGWDIGIDGMRVGGIRRLNVPKEAGYGDKDIGAGRGADLFFQLELIHVSP